MWWNFLLETTEGFWSRAGVRSASFLPLLFHQNKKWFRLEWREEMLPDRTFLAHPGPEHKGKMVVGNFHTSHCPYRHKLALHSEQIWLVTLKNHKARAEDPKCPKDIGNWAGPGFTMAPDSCRQSRLTQDLDECCLCHQPCAAQVSPFLLCVWGGGGRRGQLRCHFAVHLFFPFPFKVGALGMELGLNSGGLLVTNTANGAPSPARTLLSWVYLWMRGEWWNCYLFSKSHLSFSWISRAPFVTAEVWRGGLQHLGATIPISRAWIRNGSTQKEPSWVLRRLCPNV